MLKRNNFIVDFLEEHKVVKGSMPILKVKEFAEYREQNDVVRNRY
jgi:hypothetical protein